MSVTVVVLLAALLLAHTLGDFTPLATPRMLRAKSDGRPIGPIAAHAAVHGLLAGLAVLLVVRPPLSTVALLSGVVLSTHLVIDLAKARVGLRMPVLKDVSANPFWWALGVDQLLHGLVLIGVAFLVLG